ncbi:acetoacetate--CoA ligase [Streptomyces ipomoeae]|uniref:Acetoacetate-CoA ligase n=2 Tax=Streptomyces ipomoeae TaxID=103232 RepID=L1KY69_9ACTN|nr:acetoacetate-CoA ligase [Streptomyces ipomoeae 91-03]
MAVEAAVGSPAPDSEHSKAGEPVMVAEGELLWTPDSQRVAKANVTRFADWLARERGLRFDGYDELWRWSVTDLEGFWGALWDYFGIRSSTPYSAVLGSRDMPGAQWFPGARLNYAEHVLRHEHPGTDALLFCSESAAPAGMAWEDFAGRVRILATRLRALGVRPGDRVCGYLPNVPQAAIAMLATTAIGAVWASASPDFGSRGVVDRFSQLRPKVLFCVDGYRYGGKTFDRREEARRIAGALPGLEHVIHLPCLDPSDPRPVVDGGLPWDEVLDHPPVPPEDFSFEHVPFDHPLWVLFSSGTTGLPKAIVHGHGGILLEQLKLQTFHMDLREGDRPLFFTTTGWMMWNFLISSLLVGACPVLYDGNPTHPEPDVLWRIAQDTRTTYFGAGPAYVDLMTKAGIVPGERYDLSALRTVMPAGSPVSPQCTAWFYRNVKADLWVATGSGGTDCCTGFVGGVPTLPVYAGEMQARSLGVAAYAYDESGHSVVDAVGELVITEPLPSMPVTFWGPDGDERYRRSYFEDFPGVWRHGDFFKVNARGGCFVLGRSDATLNRQGVRIGTAEIYRVVEALDQVAAALVVSLDLPDEKFFMPLFVALDDGVVLDPGLEDTIRDLLRREYSPRHVPDRIIQVPAVPTTLTGKKLEVPARRILLGTPVEQAADRSTVADPRALDALAQYARTQRDYPPATAPA